MSKSSIVRISNEAKVILEELAHKSGESMLSILDKALKEYNRRKLLEDSNLAYERLRANADASQELDEELASMDATLADGLGPAESWGTSDIQSANRKGPEK